MKAIILAAGYGTRLYPLTLHRPKSLLPVAGRPMVEHVLDALTSIGGLDHAYLVTNARFAGQFEAWAAEERRPKRPWPLSILNDGTADEATKLGAIGDLHLVLTRGPVDDDIVVVAGDNLFSQPLDGFGEFCRGRPTPVVGLYDVGDLEAIRRYNAIELDADGRILHFEEKPRQPRSTLTAIALYYYPRAALPLIGRYIQEGRNPDQPGRLIQWMVEELKAPPFYTWRVPGLWFDIGSKESLAAANRLFSKRAKARAA